MSQLTDKYGDVYILAQKLGVANLNAQEDNGHLTLSGSAPTQYVVNQVWDKVKEIDPDMSDGDLTSFVDESLGAHPGRRSRRPEAGDPDSEENEPARATWATQGLQARVPG